MAYEAKTKPTAIKVEDFIAKVPNEQRRDDAYTLLKMMKKVTKKEPKMWGPTMIGFGNYHYKYATGHEGDCFQIGFSPRKASLTLYIMMGFERHKALMSKLGKHKTAKCCLYINKLADVDMKVLEELTAIGFREAKQLADTNKGC